MGQYNGATITATGQNIIAQALAGTALTWTVMKTSSAEIASGTDLTTLTSLDDIEQSVDITDASVYNSNILQVSARFSNTSVTTAYYIYTVGIYGYISGGSESLIAVMTAVTPDEMPVYDADAPSAFIFNTQISVQNASSITMSVNDTGTATVADLERKVDVSGGDISDTVVDTFTTSTDSYPVPSVGDTVKVIAGKIVKFAADIVANFTGATSSTAGAKGLVPAPSAGDQYDLLRGDGTWVTPQNNATTTAAGYPMDARMGYTLQNEIDSLNDSFVIPDDRRLTVSTDGCVYQELSNDTWTDLWSYRPVYKNFTASQTGIAVTFTTVGMYLVLEGVQRNYAGFTTSVDIYVVTYAGSRLTYNKIYTGQSATYTVSTSDATMSFTNYTESLNLGIVVFSIL